MSMYLPRGTAKEERDQRAFTCHDGTFTELRMANETQTVISSCVEVIIFSWKEERVVGVYLEAKDRLPYTVVLREINMAIE